MRRSDIEPGQEYAIGRSRHYKLIRATVIEVGVRPVEPILRGTRYVTGKRPDHVVFLPHREDEARGFLQRLTAAKNDTRRAYRCSTSQVRMPWPEYEKECQEKRERSEMREADMNARRIRGGAVRSYFFERGLKPTVIGVDVTFSLDDAEQIIDALEAAENESEQKG